MTTSVFLYPWDILDEGVEETARSLEKLGVRGASIALVYHQAKVLLPHNPRRRVFHHPSGRSYFPVNRERYGRLRPLESELLREYPGCFLSDVLEAFHRRGIRVNAWVVVFHSGRLAGENPGLALRNFRGEPSAHSLCPSWGAVFRYGLELLEDIAAAGVDELHLESVDYAGFLHGAHHEMQAYTDTAALDRLLGLCFCESCLERAEKAGVNGALLRREAEKQAEAFFAMEPSPATDPALWKAYDDLRCGRISEFYRQLRERVSVPVRPILWMPEGCDPRLSGVDIRAIAPCTDGVIAAYPSAPEEVEGFVDRVRRQAPGGYPVTGGVRLMAPQTVEPGQVDRYRRHYAASGVEELIFYNYGMAPMPFLARIGEQI